MTKLQQSNSHIPKEEKMHNAAPASKNEQSARKGAAHQPKDSALLSFFAYADDQTKSIDKLHCFENEGSKVFVNVIDAANIERAKSNCAIVHWPPKEKTMETQGLYHQSLLNYLWISAKVDIDCARLLGVSFFDTKQLLAASFPADARLLIVRMRHFVDFLHAQYTKAGTSSTSDEKRKVVSLIKIHCRAIFHFAYYLYEGNANFKVDSNGLRMIDHELSGYVDGLMSRTKSDKCVITLNITADHMQDILCVMILMVFIFFVAISGALG